MNDSYSMSIWGEVEFWIKICIIGRQKWHLLDCGACHLAKGGDEPHDEAKTSLSKLHVLYIYAIVLHIRIVSPHVASKVFTAGNPQLRSATLFLRCLRCCCLRSHRCRCLSCLRWSSLLMFLYTQLLVLMLVLKCLTPCLENKAKSQLSVWGLFLQKQPKLKQTTTSLFGFAVTTPVCLIIKC